MILWQSSLKDSFSLRELATSQRSSSFAKGSIPDWTHRCFCSKGSEPFSSLDPADSPPAREEDNRCLDIVMHEAEVRFFQCPEPPEDYVPKYTFNDSQEEETGRADRRQHHAPRLAFDRENNLDLSKGSPNCLSSPVDIPRRRVSRRYVGQFLQMRHASGSKNLRSIAYDRSNERFEEQNLVPDRKITPSGDKPFKNGMNSARFSASLFDMVGKS
ncbi:hypothetical protein TNCV_4832321 [Trichonephila clavipes]|nr:hypothetical protein TNCV_4832321 [Trichonephila clavipes]